DRLIDLRRKRHHSRRDRPGVPRSASGLGAAGSADCHRAGAVRHHPCGQYDRALDRQPTQRIFGSQLISQTDHMQPTPSSGQGPAGPPRQQPGQREAPLRRRPLTQKSVPWWVVLLVLITAALVAAALTAVVGFSVTLWFILTAVV